MFQIQSRLGREGRGTREAVSWKVEKGVGFLVCVLGVFYRSRSAEQEMVKVEVVVPDG